MKQATFIDRDEFGRCNLADNPSAILADGSAERKSEGSFFSRAPKFLKLIFRFSFKNRNANGDRNSNNGSTEQNVPTQPAVVLMPEQHISRDVFGRGGTAFLDNVQIKQLQSNTVSFSGQGTEPSISEVQVFQNLSPNLSSTISESSGPSSDHTRDIDGPCAESTDVNEMNETRTKNELYIYKCQLYQSNSRREYPLEECHQESVPCRDDRVDSFTIETEEAYHMEEYDPDVTISTQYQLEREMSVGSACDNEPCVEVQ